MPKLPENSSQNLLTNMLTYAIIYSLQKQRAAPAEIRPSTGAIADKGATPMSTTTNLTTTVETPELSSAEFAEWAVSEALSALGQADRAIEKLDPDQSFDA